MKTETRNFALDALMVAVALALPVAAAQAEVDVTFSHSAAQSEDIRDGYEAKAQLKGEHWGIWGSYGSHDQIMVTQSSGELSLVALGGSYRDTLSDRVSWYIDAGVASVSGSYRPRIMKEGVWFSFKPTFGKAHWLPDDNYLQEGLEFGTDFDPAPIVRIGGQIEVTDNLSIDISYRFLHAKQFLSIKDPAMAKQHGWWEGTFDRDLSSLNVGFNWEF